MHMLTYMQFFTSNFRELLDTSDPFQTPHLTLFTQKIWMARGRIPNGWWFAGAGALPVAPKIPSSSIPLICPLWGLPWTFTPLPLLSPSITLCSTSHPLTSHPLLGGWEAISVQGRLERTTWDQPCFPRELKQWHRIANCRAIEIQFCSQKRGWRVL